jgi:hypothetical protein
LSKLGANFEQALSKYEYWYFDGVFARHVRKAGNDKVETSRDVVEGFCFFGRGVGLGNDSNCKPSVVHRLSSLVKHGLRIRVCVDLVDSMWV